jgi:hypothetical protein
MFNLALLLQRNNKHPEAAEYWRRYLTNDAQSEWAARARRSLKFCHESSPGDGDSGPPDLTKVTLAESIC